MQIMLSKPIMLKYLGLELYFSPGDFEMLRKFRKEASEDWKNCSCRVDSTGYLYRCSFFSQQLPTDLEPGGELDPTEIEHHLPLDIKLSIGLLLGNEDPFNYDNWVSEDGGRITRNYTI